MASTESIRELAEPILASAGLELWDVEIIGDVVRIMVERPGGVDLDALSAASAVLSPLLDAHPEATPDSRYQLEVSSPGVERTLRTPEQYRRYVGLRDHGQDIGTGRRCPTPPRPPDSR